MHHDAGLDHMTSDDSGQWTAVTWTGLMGLYKGLRLGVRERVLLERFSCIHVERFRNKLL